MKFILTLYLKKMNATYKTLLSLVLSTFLVFVADAQQNILLHTDKAFYVSGEKIWYSLYLPQELQDKSYVLKVFAVNAKGEIMDDYYLRSEGQSMVGGYYAIPFDATTGPVRLAFYAVNNFSIDLIPLITASFPVYNDLEKLDVTKIKLQDLKGEPAELSSQNLTVSVSSTATAPHPGDQIPLHIEIKDSYGRPLDGDLSISVFDPNQIPHTDLRFSNIHQAALPQDAPLRDAATDILLQGELQLSSGRMISTVEALGAFARPLNSFYYATPGTSGLFSIAVPDYYNSMSFQFIGHPYDNKKNFHVVFNDPVFIPDSIPLPYSEAILSYLDQSRERKKIAQYFGLFDPAPDTLPKPEANVLKPDYTYKVKDYQAFATIGAFFKEITTSLTFKQSGKTYVASLYNPGVSVYAWEQLRGDPLFIIDGKVTRDADFIARFNLEPVQTVELFYVARSLRQMFNLMGNNGVVYIHTNLPDITLPKDDEEDVFNVSGLLPHNSFIPPAIPDQVTPELGPVAYWNPQLSVTGGKLDTTYQHSDERGDYVIQVVVRSKDGGIGVGEMKLNVTY
ncbi:MAG: hypothetical protein KDC28_12935 [Saprospiraceae bacterium]|nr:hypothetical protein [Saprospiraceae bacterium]MCB9321087.1 hypothetical protein [Lewinellaceae bacterium]